MVKRNSARPITPLGQRMIEDMTIRNLSATTQASYVHWVKSFALHIGRSPDQATIEDVRAFQLHLVRRNIACAMLNQAVSGLRFFFGITLGRADLPVRIPHARKAKSLPIMLGADTDGRLLEAVEDFTCRVALATVYATGLRTSEVIAIRIAHTETERKIIHVVGGKGAKDHYVPLSPGLMTLLRAYWKLVRTRPWLFMDKARTGMLAAMTLNAAIKDAALSAKRQLESPNLLMTCKLWLQWWGRYDIFSIYSVRFVALRLWGCFHASEVILFWILGCCDLGGHRFDVVGRSRRDLSSDSVVSDFGAG